MAVMDVWKQCKGKNHITAINQKAIRLVESQTAIATRKLVDSIDEQIILEELIETSKPMNDQPQLNQWHYLLFTPFRYPPLQYGSRFGTRLEPSLWYGSSELETAMAEKAFYQFNFLRASDADYGIVQIPLTAFSTQIKTSKGVNLTVAPFATYSAIISSPTDYRASQQLGKSLREENIQALIYQSARCQNKGNNIALFTPIAFQNKTLTNQSFQSWACIVNHNVIEFIQTMDSTIYKKFFIDVFLVNGELPFPAN